MGYALDQLHVHGRRESRGPGIELVGFRQRIFFKVDAGRIAENADAALPLRRPEGQGVQRFGQADEQGVQLMVAVFAPACDEKVQVVLF